jgi:hypothetical protein
MNFQFLLPFVVFLVTSVLMYTISADEKKNELGTIMLRNILPALILSILVFTILKFKDSQIFNHEPMMYGNYFD